MSKFKTITDEQFQEWTPDGEHCFDVYIFAKNFTDWLKNIPECDEYGRNIELDFRKWDDDMLITTYEAPDWWCDVDRDELEQAVCDKLHLKMEWVDGMACNG